MCLCCLGKILERRERRVQALQALGLELMDQENLTVEQLQESLRRYILVHWGGTPYTVNGMVEEVLAKVQYTRERQTRALLQ